MTDAQMVRKLMQLEKVRIRMNAIIDEIEMSDHPRADEIAGELFMQCWFAASPDHVCAPYLEKYELINGELVRKAK